MKSDSFALRVAGVAAMTRLFQSAPCHPAGEHPANAPCRRGLFSPLSARKATPAGEKNRPGFFGPLLQGVTHYTWQAKSCARLSLWTPFMQGLRPAPRRLRLRGKAVPVTVLCHLGGYPITAVITVTTVTAQRTPAEKRKELNAYALRNPAFPETQGRLRGCL